MIAAIENTPMAYDWGSHTAIAELLGRLPSGEPEAELWLGAHPASPARLIGSSATLAEIAPDLPFLLKVLAAEAPLSLQAHPDVQGAREGFELEEREKTSPDKRNYRDPYAKPEMILALSDPLRALCGFRAVENVREELSPWIGVAGISELLDVLKSDSDLPKVVSWLLSSAEDAALITAALTSIADKKSGPTWETVRYLADHRPGDAGIAVSVLLNTVVLRPGQVLDVPAGRIHAYLRGSGIELMGSSDNVLRGGLTSKRIDVSELTAVLDFRPGPPSLLTPVSTRPGVEKYETHASGLMLTVVNATTARIQLSSPAIALSVGGSSQIEGIQIPAGGSAFITDVQEVEVSASRRLFLAQRETGS